MPLFTSETLGTHSDGSKVEEYCRFCFQEGQFTSDCTMEEMIQLCSRFVNEWSKFTGKSQTREEAIARMRLQFPLLRRWAQKEDTQNEYHKSLSRVLDYMHTHLNENPGLDKLSDIANLSPYHFHRMFKAVIGVNTGAYQLRLRMEYIAGQLQSEKDSLEQLAEKTGYNGTSALSKAFRKYYGMAPSVYRSLPVIATKYKSVNENFPFSVCSVPTFSVLCAPVLAEEPMVEACTKAWKSVENFAQKKGLLTSDAETIGLSLNAHKIDIPGDRIFYAGLSVSEAFIAEEPFCSLSIDAGTFAVFSIKGSFDKLSELYRYIYFEWLPAGPYLPGKGLAFEKYLDNPHQVPAQEVRTEVYLPVISRP
jgi:AraC family transcriptional regulator